jgi:hypothetical protein
MSSTSPAHPGAKSGVVGKYKSPNNAAEAWGAGGPKVPAPYTYRSWHPAVLERCSEIA